MKSRVSPEFQTEASYQKLKGAKEDEKAATESAAQDMAKDSKDLLYVLEGRESKYCSFAHIRVAVILRRASTTLGPFSYIQNRQK